MMTKQQNKFYLSVFTFLLFMTTKAHSTDLINLYELARQNDPLIQSARAEQKAKQETLPQAKSTLLPNVALTNSNTSNRNSEIQPGRFGTQATTLTVKQPVFQADRWFQYRQAESRVAQSEAELSVAEQELILRVAEQYFNHLQAKDQVQTTRAQRLAFAKQLEQTKQRFKAGLISVTDVHEAKAKHDNAVAEEITAENELADQTEKMREIVGQSVPPLQPLKKELLFSPPPQNVNYWITKAQQNNKALQAARHNLQAAQTDIKTQKAGHFPSLQVVGNVTRGNAGNADLKRNTASSVGVEISLPLFSGGLVNSKTRAAYHNYQKANQDLEAKHRQIERDVRQAYNGILTQLDQIKAFKQAVISNRSALKSTQAAFEVGNRTIVDVLDAQSEVLKAEYNYAKSRYGYILSRLRLKRATGLLSTQDLEKINQFLVAASHPKKG